MTRPGKAPEKSVEAPVTELEAARALLAAILNLALLDSRPREGKT